LWSVSLRGKRFTDGATKRHKKVRKSWPRSGGLRELTIKAERGADSQTKVMFLRKKLQQKERHCKLQRTFAETWKRGAKCRFKGLLLVGGTRAI